MFFVFRVRFGNFSGMIGNIVSLFISSGTFVYFLLLYINHKKGKENNINQYYFLATQAVGLLNLLLNNVGGYFNIYNLLIVTIQTIITIVSIVCLYKIFFNKINDNNREKITKIFVTTILIELASSIIRLILSIIGGLPIMIIIDTIIAIAVDILIIHFFNYYDIHYNNLFNNGKKKVPFYFDIAEWKKYLIVAAVTVIVMNAYTVISIMPSSSSSSKSKSNNLTKQEKEWYERNI